VVSRLTQGVGQLLVLGHCLGELALRLQQPLLERAHALGRILEPAPEGQHLFLEGPHLVRVGTLLGPGAVGPAFLVVLVDRDHLLGRSRSDPTPVIARVGIPFFPGRESFSRDCRVYPLAWLV
jgi:hypothetical protein